MLSEFPLLYRFTVLLNSGGSTSPWSGFWSEFPRFMGMGVVPAPSRLTFFRAPQEETKKDFSLFSCGATPSRTVPKTQPLQLERVDLRSQKERILGKRIVWGRVGWTGQKKEKRMCKKRREQIFKDKFILGARKGT